MNTHRIGKKAEDDAVSFCLSDAPPGTRVIARNWRSRLGEIDLVLEQGCILVFTEIRWRKHEGALESVDARKRRRLELAARAFLSRYYGKATDVRFDVIAGSGEQWIWIRDAWRPDY